MEPSILEEEAVSSVLATRRLAVLEAFLSAWNAHDVHRLGLIGSKLRFWPSCGTLQERIDRHGFRV